jgi:hypothetical protein
MQQPNQPTLFDPPERAKTDAIAQVERNNREFVYLAYELLQGLAFCQSTITTLDVWARLELCVAPLPTNPRAMGPVFLRARHAGLITPTNQWVPSGRVSDHNQQLRVWRSEVYRG